jgi:hypothetical protein
MYVSCGKFSPTITTDLPVGGLFVRGVVWTIAVGGVVGGSATSLVDPVLANPVLADPDPDCEPDAPEQPVAAMMREARTAAGTSHFLFLGDFTSITWISFASKRTAA